MGDLKSKSPLAPRIKYSDASVVAELYDRDGEEDGRAYEAPERCGRGQRRRGQRSRNGVILDWTSDHGGSPATLTGLVTGFTTLNITNGVRLNI